MLYISVSRYITKNISFFFYAVKKQRARVDTIDLKLGANLGEISLTLQNRARLVGALHIKGGEAAVIMKRSYTQVNAKLTDFEFLDLRECTRHNKVCSVFHIFQTTCCPFIYELNSLLMQL